MLVWLLRSGLTILRVNQNLLPRIARLLWPYRWPVMGGAACLVVALAMELYPPLVWLRVVDVELPAKNINGMAFWLGTYLLSVVIGQIFTAARTLLLEIAGQRLTLDLRLHLYSKLQNQSAEYLSRQRAGDLISRITSDVEAIQDLLINGTDTVLASALRLVAVAGILIILQPTLGLLVILPMFGVGFLLARYNTRVRPFYRAARRRLGEFTARLSENITGMRLIQSFAREDGEYGVLKGLGQALLGEQIGAVKLRNKRFPFIRFVAALGQFLMLAGGVAFIMMGKFTLGGLLAYRGYGRYFFGPVDDLVGVNDLVQRASAAGARIFEVLDAPISLRNVPDAQPIPPLRGEIAFENVSFGYDEGHPVLRDISLRILPGQRVVILGPSGIGKSTLLTLVARFYDPTFGRVLVDGIDVRQITLQSLRSQIGQVQQDTFLFNASVMENVRFGRPSATKAEVEQACRVANAHAFICDLPKGYDTLVGERGVKLSGGQKQRISIARAVLANPAMLLLDEPTSAVEPDSEAAILEALERLMHGRTTLIVTHRLSLARSADCVVVMAGGRLAEVGSPQELAVIPGGRFAGMMT